MKDTKSAEAFILDNPNWQKELELLRTLFLSSGLQESIKWGIPIYSLEGKNVAGMAAFKSYVGIWFYQGALLRDQTRKLICAQEGITKALRQWRFSDIYEIESGKEILLEYIVEASANVREGKEIKPEKNKPLDIPGELQEAFEKDPALKNSFETLSLSKRREFAEHISSAKRMETRFVRLDKIIPMILKGEGLNDKYLKEPRAIHHKSG